MNKYFYFGSCVFSLFAVSIVSIYTTELKAIVSFGFMILICLAGLILCEMQRQQMHNKKFERDVREQLEAISEEMEVMMKMKMEQKHCNENQSFGYTGALLYLLHKLGTQKDKSNKNKDEDSDAEKG